MIIRSNNNCLTPSSLIVKYFCHKHNLFLSKIITRTSYPQFSLDLERKSLRYSTLSLLLLRIPIPDKSKLGATIITWPEIKDEGNTFPTDEQSVDSIATISSHLIEVIGRPSRLHKEEAAADRKEKDERGKGREERKVKSGVSRP